MHRTALIAFLMLLGSCLVRGDENISPAGASIQSAVAAVNSGGTVFMATGTYNQNNIVFPNSKSFRLLGTEGTVIDCGDASGITFATSSATVTIEGITFQNCQAERGGAVSIIRSNAFIKNCKFQSNTAVVANSTSFGGGLYLEASNATITDSVFDQNVAQNGNGAAVAMLSSYPTFINCNFTANHATDNGGAMYMFQSNPTINQCNLIQNRAAGKAFNSFGGAMYLYNSLCNLNRVTIDSNAAGGDGGGLYLYSSGLDFSDASVLAISNTVINNNAANGTGGGLYLYAVAPSLTNVQVTNNKANADGGGLYMYVSSGRPVIANFTATQNAAGGDGGGIYLRVHLGGGTEPPVVDSGLIQNNTCLGNGGGMYFAGFSGVQPAVFSNIDIFDNKAATRGGGVYIFDTSPEIVGVKVRRNSAGSDGGGAWIGVFQNKVNATTIVDSHFDNNVATAGLGGGVWLHLESLAAPTLHDLSLDGNSALSGGGLYVEYKIDASTVQIRDSVFTSNVASFYGGGSYFALAKVDLINSTYANNSASGSSGRGGGVYVVALPTSTVVSTPTFTNSHFLSNTAILSGGGVALELTHATFAGTDFKFNRASAGTGGGVWLNLGPNQVIGVNNCDFISNTAMNGGAFSAVSNVACLGKPSISSGFLDAQCSADCPQVSVGSSDFTYNSAITTTVVPNYGGAFYGSNLNLQITGSTFTYNTIDGLREIQGGGLALVASCADISTTDISHNIARGANFDMYGGGLFVGSGIAKLTTVTLTHNEVGSNPTAGAVVAFGGGLSALRGSLVLNGVQLLDNTAGGLAASGEGGGLALNSQSFARFATVTANHNSAFSPLNRALGGGILVQLASGISFLGSTSVSNNTADGVGGGLYFESAADTAISNTTVRANSATRGGGVAILRTAVSISSSSIFSNTASFSAGAVYADSLSSLALNSTQVINNHAQYLGGIYLLPPATLTVAGGSIVDNNLPLYYEFTAPQFTRMFGQGLTDARAGTAQEISILARDSADKKRTQGGDTFQIDFTGPGNVTVEVIDHDDGTYTLSYHTPVAGIYLARMQIVTYNGTVANIIGSPTSINVAAGEASLDTTLVNPSEGIDLCVVNSITVVTKDADGNSLIRGGEVVSALLTGGDNNVFNYSLAVKSYENGSYSTRFFLASGGEYQIHVFLRGEELTTSPFTFSIRETGTFICSDALLGTFVALIGISSAVYLVLMFLVFWFRATRAIHSAAPLFCYLILVGAILLNVTVGIWLAKPTEATCNLAYWIWGLGFSLMFSALFAKNYRIYYIWKKAQNLKFRPISNQLLFKIMSLISGLHFLIMIIWNAVEHSTVVQAVLPGSDSTLARLTLSCYNNPIFLGIFLFYKLALLTWGIALSIGGRKIQREYNESRHIAFAIYNYTFIVIVQAIFSYTVSDPETQLFLSGAVTLLKVAIIVAALFVPKFIDIYHHYDSTVSSSGSSSSKSRRNESGSKSGSKSAKSN